MPDANSLDHHNQKPSLSKSNRLPPSSHPILYPSSAPANITTFSSSGSFSSNAAAPSVPSRQSWAANMVQHRHLAKKKGIEEKFNQSVKEAVRRENMQSHDGLYTNAILASPSSGDTGDNDVGGEEMQVDHQDAEQPSPIFPLPASPHTAQPPAARSSPEIIVLDSDENDLQYPPDSPFSPISLNGGDPEPEILGDIQTASKDVESARDREPVSPTVESPVLLNQPLSEKAKGKQRAIDPPEDADDEADDNDLAEEELPEPLITHLPKPQSFEEDEISSDEQEVKVKPAAGSKRRVVLDDDDELSFEVARAARKVLQQEIFGDADSDSGLSDERPVELRNDPEKGPNKRVSIPDSDNEDEEPPTKKFAAASSGSGSPTKRISSTSLWKARESSVIDISSGDDNEPSKPHPRPVMTTNEPSASQPRPKKTGQVLNIEASIDAYLNSWQTQIRRLHKNRKTMSPKELNAQMAELLGEIKDRQYWLLSEHISKIKLPSLLRKIGDSYDDKVRNDAELILDCFEQRFNSESLFIWRGATPIARKNPKKK